MSGKNAEDLRLLAIPLTSLQSAKADVLAGFVDSEALFTSLGYADSTGTILAGINNSRNIVAYTFGINAYGSGFYFGGAPLARSTYQGHPIRPERSSVGTSDQIALAAPRPPAV